MKTIYKYVVNVADDVFIKTKTGAKLLDVQTQYDQLNFWFIVQTNTGDETLHYRIIGTGHPVPENIGKHVATVQQNGGMFVWHIFEGDK